jgi:inner membrane protein
MGMEQSPPLIENRRRVAGCGSLDTASLKWARIGLGRPARALLTLGEVGADMLIAHLPASYLWSRILRRRLGKRLVPLGLLASVLPDIDLLYFYFVDGRAHPHHTYWTHQPVAWALLASLAAVLVLWERRLRDAMLIFFSNILLHLALDTVAGGICWLYPLSHQAVQLVRVPAAHGHWLVSFLHHWSFFLELAICAAALTLWGQTRGRAASSRAPAPELAPRSPIRSSTDLSIFKIAHR